MTYMGKVLKGMDIRIHTTDPLWCTTETYTKL